ncbi:MAG: hypothetical protein RL497_784 [Pseudomonadota bacterium]
MHDALIAQLATQIDTLLHQYQTLQAEHQQLKQQAALLREERQALIEKNTLAYTRIETMIARLKLWDTTGVMKGDTKHGEAPNHE